MSTALGGEAIDPEVLQEVVAGHHSDPHRVLGRHNGVVRALRPGAQVVWLLEDGGGRTPMTLIHPDGMWEAPIDASAPGYRLEAQYESGTFVFDDPYRSWPTLGDLDIHLVGQGRHRCLWEILGAHLRSHQGLQGVSFAVWAPNAKAVRVVGDWNFWDGRVHQMRELGGSGIWELFIPGVEEGARYKFEMVTAEGRLILKADPMARAAEVPPGTASLVAAPRQMEWGDQEWMDRRARTDILRSPMSIYEMHLGAWRHGGEGHDRPLTYLELAEQLPAYVGELGFTHVEFMPVAEYPFSGSWGYQVSSYYAPTSRYGTPDEFRLLVDALHRAGIGVLVDWVPAHFPRDEWALARFDGTALYEHDDPRRGAQPDWGTLVFNFGRNEVRNFLVANALYWLEEFH
ncbi:MAG: GlgB N-terminal domain-containing protein, partial [Acidimicrobiales bacterium]